VLRWWHLKVDLKVLGLKSARPRSLYLFNVRMLWVSWKCCQLRDMHTMVNVIQLQVLSQINVCSLMAFVLFQYFRFFSVISFFFFNILGFSLSSWLVQKSYNLSVQLDHSHLMSDLGLSRYLWQPECTHALATTSSSGKYSFWQFEMTSDVKSCIFSSTSYNLLKIAFFI